MSSMIGLPSDRALVEDDECLRLFIFKNLLNLPLLMHHDIFFSLSKPSDSGGKKNSEACTVPYKSFDWFPLKMSL